MLDAVAPELWKAGDLIIDVGAQRVFVDGTAIALPKLSFNFLLTLVRAAPKVLTIDELMDAVWPGLFVNAETVTQRAKLLRDALGDDARQPRFIAVSRGRGYQLIPEPARIDGAPSAVSFPSGTAGNDRLVPALRRRTLAVVGAMLLGLMLAGGLLTVMGWPGDRTDDLRTRVRVAVLPFDNLSRDPSDAFIARGISEMVLNRLSSIRGLTVIARDSALYSPATFLPVQSAGKELDVDYVVKGSVQRIGGTVRVTSFLIDTSQGARLWSERFDWPLNRLYALQDRIADRVAASLEARARGIGPLPEPTGTSENPDAYLAYLKGKSLLSRFTVAETDAAASQFERAIKLDPDFGDALIALFDARMQGADLRRDDLAPFRARYQPLLDRALEQDPESGAGLFARAMWSNLPADEREKLFRRAAERDPSNSRGLTAFAQFLDRGASLSGARTRSANAGEARAVVDRVLAIDPLSPRTRWWAVQRGWTVMTPEEIEKGFARELEFDPLNYVVVARYAFRRWMFHGETAEAIERIERIIASDPQNPTGPHFAAAFYLDANDPAAAHAVAVTTPASRDSTRVLFAQYAGDWRRAGTAALDARGSLFNEYQNWIWADTVRDYALHTGEYDRAIAAITSQFGFDPGQPRVGGIAQMIAAPPLGQILLAKGDKARGNRLLAATVQWIDTHPSYGMGGVMRYRAAAMMLLGQRDQALSNLRASIETAHDCRHWWYIIDHDPIWAPARGDPRFAAIARICREAARAQREKLDALRRSGKLRVIRGSGAS